MVPRRATRMKPPMERAGDRQRGNADTPAHGRAGVSVEAPVVDPGYIASMIALKVALGRIAAAHFASSGW